MRQHLDIIFTGQTRSNAAPERVRSNLALLLRVKTRDARLKKAFEGTPVALAKDLPPDTAKLYARAFTNAGARVRLVPSITRASRVPPTPWVSLGVSVILVATALVVALLTSSVETAAKTGGFLMLSLAIAVVAGIRGRHSRFKRSLRTFNWTAGVAACLLLAPHVSGYFQGPPQTIASETGQVRLTVPAGWNSVNSDALLKVADRRDGKIVVLHKVVKDIRNLQAEAETHIQRVRNNVQVHWVAGPTLRTVGDRQAVEYVLELEVSGARFTQLYRLVDGDTSYYMVMAGTSAQGYADSATELRDIADSLRIL